MNADGNNGSADMAHANTEQLIAAWSTLGERDVLILRKMAASLIDGTCYSEPLDLMHEALTRSRPSSRDPASPCF